MAVGLSTTGELFLDPEALAAGERCFSSLVSLSENDMVLSLVVSVGSRTDEKESRQRLIEMEDRDKCRLQLRFLSDVASLRAASCGSKKKKKGDAASDTPNARSAYSVPSLAVKYHVEKRCKVRLNE